MRFMVTLGPNQGIQSETTNVVEKLARGGRDRFANWYFADGGSRRAAKKALLLSSPWAFALGLQLVLIAILAVWRAREGLSLSLASTWRPIVVPRLPGILFSLGGIAAPICVAVVSNALRRAATDRSRPLFYGGSAALWTFTMGWSITFIDSLPTFEQLKALFIFSATMGVVFVMAALKRPLMTYFVGAPLLAVVESLGETVRKDSNAALGFVALGALGLASARLMLSSVAEYKSTGKWSHYREGDAKQAFAWTGLIGVVLLVGVSWLIKGSERVGPLVLPLVVGFGLFANVIVARIQYRRLTYWPDWAISFYGYPEMESGMRSLLILLVGLLVSMTVSAATTWAASATALALLTALGLHLIENSSRK
jgi:hypothetical protein